MRVTWFTWVVIEMVLTMVLVAAPSGAWLEEAHGLVKELRFSEALARLDIARRTPSLTPEVLREVLELSAYCQIAEGQWSAAEATWTELLRTMPTAEPTAALSSPKVLKVYGKAKSTLYPPDYVRLEERDAPIGILRVALVDPWKSVSTIVLRSRAQDQWVDLPLKKDGDVWGFSRPDSRTRLEWYVEARNANGQPVAHLATAALPRVWDALEPLPVTPPKPQLSTVAPSPQHPTRLAGFVTLGVGVALAAVATGLQVSGVGKRQAARNPNQPPGDYAATALAAENAGISEQRWSAGLFGGAGLCLAVGVALAW